MVGGFSSIHAVHSRTNRQLCSRCLIVVIHASGISIPLPGNRGKRFREGVANPNLIKAVHTEGWGRGGGEAALPESGHGMFCRENLKFRCPVIVRNAS